MEREILEQILAELRAIRNLLEIEKSSLSRKNSLCVASPKKHEDSQKEHEDSDKLSMEIEDSLDIGYQFIINSLKSRGLKIKSFAVVEENPSTLNKLALLMGKHYQYIRPVYKQIKKTLSSGEPFSISLKGLPQEQIAYITNWCTELHRLALLQDYKYYRSPYFVLRAKVNRTPEIINFFTGGWLEIFVRETISQILRSKEVFPYLIRNVKVEYPNGDGGEFDLFLNLKSNLFWFESKAGEYQSHISKYSKIAKMFSLPKERSFLILAEITPDKAKDLENLFNISVVYVEDFPSVFKEKVEELL